jgi:phage protein U
VLTFGPEGSPETKVRLAAIIGSPGRRADRNTGLTSDDIFFPGVIFPAAILGGKKI